MFVSALFIINLEFTNLELVSMLFYANNTEESSALFASKVQLSQIIFESLSTITVPASIARFI